MLNDQRISELLSRWDAHKASGDLTTVEALCRDCPELVGPLQETLRQRQVGPSSAGAGASRPVRAIPMGETLGTDGSSGTVSAEEFFAGLDPPETPGELGRLGSYRLVKLLGAGGMGAVFQAIDTKLGRTVALKVMRPTLARSALARERFVREARAAAALEHDHIVTIFEIGDDRGTPYLAMPLLAGESLEDRLAREERLPTAEVLRIGREIAEGLDAAHQRGLVHRDIKPGNIWLERERGRIKILDFGLARAVDEAFRLTQDGAVIGTPAYMAPEQARDAGNVDLRGDLFSLGSVLYRMTTGRLPFTADSTAALLVALVHDPVVPPRSLRPEVPAALSDLIVRLMAKSPADRPDSARAVVEAIRSIESSLSGDVPLIDLNIPVEDEQLRPRKPDRSGRRRWLIGGAVAVLLFGALGAFLSSLIGMFDDKGRLTIQTPLPYILVVVRQSGQQVAVVDPEKGATVSLWPGSYDLELTGQTQGLVLATDRITLHRGDHKIVRVVLPSPSTASARAISGPASPVDDAMPGLILHPTRYPRLGRWQVETRQPRAIVSGLAWSPDTRRLALVSNERNARIVDAKTLDLVGLLVGHAGPVLAVSWSPDGRQLATASQDGTVRLWSAEGAPGAVLKGHAGPVPGVAWSRDGARLASCGDDRVVRIWDRDGTPGPVLEGHRRAVSSVAWSPDGRRLVSGSSDQTARLWSVDGKPGPVLATTGTASAVAWSGDGQRIAAACRSDQGAGGVAIWTADGKPVVLAKRTPFDASALAWSPDGRRLVAAGPDASVRFFDPEGKPGLLSQTHGSGTLAIAWSPDGRGFATAGAEGRVRFWEANGTLRPETLVALPRCDFNAVAWSPSGHQVAFDFPIESTVRVWNVDGAPGPVLNGVKSRLNTVAWSPDGRRIASGDTGSTIRLWSDDGSISSDVRVPAAGIMALAWSPNGSRLAAACRDGTIRMIKADGTAGRILKGHTSAARAVAWSPDGQKLASAGNDGTVRLWDPSDGHGTIIAKRPEAIACLAWNRDGRRLAVGGAGPLLMIWAEGVPPRPLKGHTAAVTSVTWSPAGRRLASASDDHTIRLWADDGAPGPVLRGDEAAVSSIAWSPDGRRMASAGFDGAVRLWNTDTWNVDWVLVPTSSHKIAVFDPAGHMVHASPGVEGDFVYFVERPRGSVALLTPAEFLKQIKPGRPFAKKNR